MEHQAGGGGVAGGRALGAAVPRAPLDLDPDWKYNWSMGNVNRGDHKRKAASLIDDDEEEDKEPLPYATNPQELIACTLEPKYMCHDEKLNRSNRELVGLYNQIGLRRRNLIRKAYRRVSLGRDLKSQLKDILQLLKVAKNLHKDILDRGGTPAPIPAHFEDKKRFY
ncbi:uncharacterized protein LOC102703387 [Oryza brachyantha]|uniref:uncharacterized protein LOC102703387 n=1 Tax=Oryza brachyantha TaxID=4533 RepID=UPI00077615D9|nr:uncharacterized protein LOC102703387 [Oryza brachyantha]